MNSNKQNETTAMDSEKDCIKPKSLLNTILNLEKVDKNLYRSTHQSINTGGRNIYGGQLIGLALSAAIDTVQSGYDVHSLHCYFIRGGLDQPVLFQVESTKEGKTYCSRSVKAVQNGLDTFSMHCSFKKQETDSFGHQFKMPKVPRPEELRNRVQILQDLRKETNEDDYLNHYYKQRELSCKKDPFEMRPVDPKRYTRENSLQPKDAIWVRAKENLGDNFNAHQIVAAYISDSYLAAVQYYPKPRIPGVFQFFSTSLDHSMWFHHPFRADEWFLYEMESPHIANGRGFSTGRYWTPDGKLVISMAQETVIRTLKANL